MKVDAPHLLTSTDAAYPANLRAGLLAVPPPVAAWGNLAILGDELLAIYCSARCPGNVILRLSDLAVALRTAGATVVGGFHSPLEVECLRTLLRGAGRLVVCPARSIEGMRLPVEWQAAVVAGRLLLLSPFEQAQRITSDTSLERNRFVAALADQVLIAHAAEGSRTEQLAREVAAAGKTLYTLPSPDNANLIALGAQIHPLAEGATDGQL